MNPQPFRLFIHRLNTVRVALFFCWQNLAHFAALKSDLKSRCCNKLMYFAKTSYLAAVIHCLVLLTSLTRQKLIEIWLLLDSG